MQNVPEPLRRFARLAERIALQFPWSHPPEHLARIRADGATFAELAQFVRDFNKSALDAYDEWADRSRDTPNAELHSFHNLNRLVDELDLWPATEPQSIAALIADLSRQGHLVMASKRAFAAMFLAKRAHESALAVPHLQPLLQDKDFRARVWAHCALARITGEIQMHRIAILSIRQACSDESNVVTLGDGRSDTGARLMVRADAEHALRVLDGHS